ADQAGIIEITSDISAAAQVLGTTRGIVWQILADPQAHHLAIQHAADAADVEQATLKRVRQSRFASAGKANKHHRDRLLAVANRALFGGDMTSRTSSTAWEFV